MAKYVKMPAAKLGDLSLIPAMYIVERQYQLSQAVL